MVKSVNDVMSRNLVTVTTDTTLVEAARKMREADTGDVLVIEDGQRLCGIVTDRDIVVRAIAEGRQPDSTPVKEICSAELTTVTPDATLQETAQRMRDADVRRIPVVDGDRAVGIVSIGDLAIEEDPKSALADISAAAPND